MVGGLALVWLVSWLALLIRVSSADVMMKKGRPIQFSVAGSVQSAFRSLMAGGFLTGNWRQYQNTSKRQLEIAWEMDLDGTTKNQPNPMYFCSEFVVVAYQEAIMSLLDRDSTILRLMNCDPEACSPMSLQGYLSNNERKVGDWCHVGQVMYNYY